MTRNTAESMTETHPPLGIFIIDDESRMISIDPKNKRNRMEKMRLRCHTKFMTSDVNNVVTNDSAMNANPAIQIETLLPVKA